MWRGLVPLAFAGDVAWERDIVCEFHGHHFPTMSGLDEATCR